MVFLTCDWGCTKISWVKVSSLSIAFSRTFVLPIYFGVEFTLLLPSDVWFFPVRICRRELLSYFSISFFDKDLLVSYCLATGFNLAQVTHDRTGSIGKKFSLTSWLWLSMFLPPSILLPFTWLLLFPSSSLPACLSFLLLTHFRNFLIKQRFYSFISASFTACTSFFSFLSCLYSRTSVFEYFFCQC